MLHNSMINEHAIESLIEDFGRAKAELRELGMSV